MHYFAAVEEQKGRLIKGKRYFNDEDGNITLENGKRVSAISWQMKGFLEFVDYYGAIPKGRACIEENSEVKLRIFPIIRGKEVIVPIGEGFDTKANVIEIHKKNNGDLILLAKIQSDDELVEVHIPHEWMI